MDKPFPAYRGDEPYVFVCYAHDDQAIVYPEIGWLHSRGVNIWYDEGISPGEEWTETLATAISGCLTFLYFITPQSVVSPHCRRELSFANDRNLRVIAVRLAPADLPGGLQLSLGDRQQILKQGLPESEYRDKLFGALTVEVGAQMPPVTPDHAGPQLPSDVRR